MINKKPNEQELRIKLLSIFQKISNKSTIQVGYDSFIQIIRESISKESTTIYILSLIAEHLNQLKPADKKDIIKMCSIFVSSITEREAQPFISRILTLLQGNITDQNSSLFTFISSVFGEIVEHSFKSEIITDMDNEQNKSHRKTYEMFQGFCVYNMKQDQRANQICGSLCLTSLIETCQLVLQPTYMKYIWENILHFIDKPNFHAKLELLNGLISFIFAAETLFKPFANVTLYKILDYLTDTDWLKRKLALNVVYTLVYYCQEEILPLKGHIVEFLKVLKSDKIKEVREVCIQTLKFFNEEEQHENEDSLTAETKNKITQSNSKSKLDVKSPPKDKSPNSSVVKHRKSPSNDKSPNSSFVKHTKEVVTRDKSPDRSYVKDKQSTQPKQKNDTSLLSLNVSDIQVGDDCHQVASRQSVQRNYSKKALTPTRKKDNPNASYDDCSIGNISKSNMNRKDDKKFVNSKMIIKRDPNHSIFNTKLNREFFSKKEEIEILFKDSNGVKKEVAPIDQFDYLNAPVDMDIIQDIEEKKFSNEKVVQNIEGHNSPVRTTYKTIPTIVNKEKKEERPLTPNNHITNDPTDKTFSNEILKQIKQLSDKQLFLINTIEQIQTNSEDKITKLTQRITELEMNVMELSNNIKSHNINNTSKQDNEQTKQKVDKTIFFPSLRENEDTFLHSISQLNIQAIKEIPLETVEEIINRLTLILLKGDNIGSILPFIQTLILLFQNKLNPVTILNMKDTFAYVIENERKFAFTENYISDITFIYTKISEN